MGDLSCKIIRNIGYLSNDPINNNNDNLEAQEEVRIAIEKIVIPKNKTVELLIRNPIVRSGQYQLISKYNLKSKLVGVEPFKKIRILLLCKNYYFH